MLDWLHTTGRLLTTASIGRVMESHREIDSTNARALEWAAAGAPSGAIVVAESQTSGRGRQGRKWEGGSGDSLLFSVVMRPAIPPDRFGLLPLAAGVALVDAMESVPGLDGIALKWPNDLLVGERKCAGILVESVITSGAPSWAVVGVGLNVNQSRFPEALTRFATSLRLATGREVARPLLLAHILEAMETRFDQTESNPDHLVKDYLEALSGIDHPVRFAHPDGQITSGVLLGVDGSGALRVAVDGIEQVYSAGEISLSGASR